MELVIGIAAVLAVGFFIVIRVKSIRMILKSFSDDNK